MISRTILLPRTACFAITQRFFAANQNPKPNSNHNAMSQLAYFRSVVDNKIEDWNAIKSKILSIQGGVNVKNIDAILLKNMVNRKQFDAALSYVDHLRSTGLDQNLGPVNGILHLYADLSEERQLTEDERKYILDKYNYLYDTYKVLDCQSCERLLHALCVIDEWQKARKVLEDIHLSSLPSHSAYSTLIATLFRVNEPTEAMKLITQSIENQRPLLYIAYEGWINYILKKYKTKKTVIKHLEDICEHISKNCECVDLKTANLIKDTFSKLGWNTEFTKISRKTGHCNSCKDTLECLKLTEEEFKLLEKAVKGSLIIGKDLFLKSSPVEFEKFIRFVEDTAPYDIVIDALNVAYSVNLYKDKVLYLRKVVEHFKRQDKKILLLGRKHMLKWPGMQHILKITCNFFTDNISQDDPYFITAAILSGSHTDLVSKDLLRGHRFRLKDPHLRGLFQRWQWQHQYMVFVGNHWVPKIQEPLAITPCAQKKDGSWHLPYFREDIQTLGQVRDGTPDWGSWLCMRPPTSNKEK